MIANSGTGNTSALAITSTTDATAVGSHLGTAAINNIYDYNKDGFMNSSDESAARSNGVIIKFIKISARCGPFAA